MNHYVCSGSCGGESVLPGVCEVSKCVKTGKPLIECKCADGKHEAINRFRGGSFRPSAEPTNLNS